MGFELIGSPQLLQELAEVLGRPKFRRFISRSVVTELVDGVSQDALIIGDPRDPPSVSRDPSDDYLIAPARAGEADYIVSGDRDLLDLTDLDPPVLSPRQFVDLLGS